MWINKKKDQGQMFIEMIINGQRVEYSSNITDYDEAVKLRNETEKLLISAMLGNYISISIDGRFHIKSSSLDSFIFYCKKH